MPTAVQMRSDFSARELRRLAATTKNANRSRRLLSLAAILDGMSRTEAARIGGMDRQTLRDWVHRFNEHGPDGLNESSVKNSRGSDCMEVFSLRQVFGIAGFDGLWTPFLAN